MFNRDSFQERFEREQRWVDRMFKIVFFTAFAIIILSVIAYAVFGVVIIRILQNLGLL